MQAIIGQPSHANDASAPLRIAVVAPPWFEVPPEGYGGIEAMCATLVNKLVSRGHEVFLLGAGRDRTRGRFVPVLAEPPSIRLGDPMVETSYASRSARALRELDVDVVHDHCLAGPLSAAGRFAPTVVTVHGPVHADLGDYYRALDDTIGLVAISEAQRRHAPDLPWEGTVHNGVVVDDFPFRDRAAKED
ncbi:MAG TPA: glycosyltransferase, partial [Actinomycetota bacterium]